MAEGDPSGVPARELRVDHEQLINVAGGYDALVGEFGNLDPDAKAASVDTGDATLTTALNGFMTSWNKGLTTMFDNQQHIAGSIRASASDYLGVDVDAAYALQGLGVTVRGL